jgi:C4-dicarboxylate-specific signal transduction histidine kinase
VQTEYRIVLPDKAVRLVAVRTQSFLKPTGEPDCIMGVSFDITECRKSEVERVELRNELAHLARALALNELSTSLAHEINQPLGAILNNATTAKELLLKNRTGNEEFSEILTDIITDTKRAGDIVRKIRGMLKKNATRLESLNINSLIDDVVALFQNQLKLRTISLCLDLQSDLMLVNGDRIKLQQVLLNLITNAVDAMKETPQGTLMICSRMHGNDTVMVNVRDSGTGIAPLIKDTMFNPFVTTKKSGLGVGLSISKSIIEEHGGKIWAEDNPDHGTTVSFTLKIR